MGHEMHRWVATETVRRIRTGEVTASACLAHYRERVERLDGALNAVVVRDLDRAAERAREADVALAAGDLWGPLHGLPMTVKESFGVAGLPTTFGVPALAGNLAHGDSDVVARLKAAGAVIFGKTNVPLDLMDFQTFNDIYGTTNNPWDVTRSPGGSSGGESAALSAGLSALGVGTDIGGSIRNPAHYAGIYGHKASYGIVSAVGHSPAPALWPVDLAVCGPLARSARDLRLALDVIAGPDALTAQAFRLNLPEFSKPLSELRVAVWDDDDVARVEPEVAARCHVVADALGRAGATVSTTARPAFSAADARQLYGRLLRAATLSRRPEETYAALQREAAKYDPDDPSEVAQRAWRALLPHHTWLRWAEQREGLRQTWRQFFADWDILVCPVASTAAHPHDHAPVDTRMRTVAGKQVPYFQQIFWAGLVTGSYLPSTVVPTGPDAQGLPIGVQLVSDFGRDLTCIGVAEALADLGFTFAPPPGY